MCDPNDLNKLFPGAKFANLSLSGSTAYEQHRLLSLFLDHNKSVKYIIWGLDVSWFLEEGSFHKYHKKVHFPEWLYEARTLGKMGYLLNIETVKMSLRQVRYLLKLKKTHIQENGYCKPATPKKISTA